MCALVTGIQTGARPIYRGAIDRRGDDAERVLERGDVEAREMEQLEPRGVGQDRLEHRRVIGAAGTKADEMLVAAAVADLDQAQPRSEEHTSELQSLMRNTYAVFCLKKKKEDNSNRERGRDVMENKN